MTVARLAEAPDQDVVARLEEEHLRRDPAALEGVHRFAIGERRVAAARVQDECQALELAAFVRHELSEVAQQLGGQVVDDAVADILEQLAGSGLSCAR
jgi:hypothetical protein